MTDYCSYTSYDKSLDDKALEDIKYVKGLYEVQSYNVKKEQYIEELLRKDYLRAIKSYRTRYDLTRREQEIPLLHRWGMNCEKHGGFCNNEYICYNIFSRML